MPFAGAIENSIAQKNENGYMKNVRMAKQLSLNIPQMFYKGSKFQVVCDNRAGNDDKARPSWRIVNHPGVGNKPTVVRNDVTLFPFRRMEFERNNKVVGAGSGVTRRSVL